MLKLSDNSIKTQMRYLFISSLIVTICIISFIIFYYWKMSINETMLYTQAETTQSVLYGIKNFMEVPLHMNECNRYFLEKGLIDIKKDNNAAKFFGGAMSNADDNVYSFSFGTADGEYYGVRRYHDSLEFMKSDKQTNGRSTYYSMDKDFKIGRITDQLGKFDPRTRDWYISAQKSRYPIFSDIYRHFAMNDLVISASYPIFDENKKFLGVLGTHITLNKLNDELKYVVKNRNAKAYIFEKKTDDLVANSENEPNFIIDSKGIFHRTNAASIKDSIIREAYMDYKTNHADDIKTFTGMEDFYIKVSEYKKYGADWILVTAVPESPYILVIKKSVWIALILSILILLAAAWISSQKINKYLLPVYDLIGITEKFSAGDFSLRAGVSEKNEIGILGHSFNNMAEHLELLINKLEQKVKERTNELEEKNRTLEKTKEKLEYSLQIDFLTGLYNRKFLITKIDDSINDFSQNGTIFSIIMMDIDFFKKINDTYGHDCGDFILQEIAKIFKTCINGKGYISRWGGEEFLILLHGTVEKEGLAIGEKIRRTVEEYEFIYQKFVIQVTITLGMAVYETEISVDDIIKHADIAVYKGKRNGRNRLEVYTENE
ncbi:diguanylate cyclase [Pectinatus sottacetonis]|uniref:diguanylate cyclase n=1 Tax=Pectinatus sottacetonis TaxID=1002795 RepID=UPI0018C7A2AF|nr:diguanylate cyclase [Pectinatus sottacetonis]